MPCWLVGDEVHCTCLSSSCSLPSWVNPIRTSMWKSPSATESLLILRCGWRSRPESSVDPYKHQRTALRIEVFPRMLLPWTQIIGWPDPMRTSRSLDEADREVVGEAEDGRQAIDLVCQLESDLVIMAIRMPNLDGLAATREITARGRPPGIGAVHLRVGCVHLRGAAGGRSRIRPQTDAPGGSHRGDPGGGGRRRVGWWSALRRPASARSRPGVYQALRAKAGGVQAAGSEAQQSRDERATLRGPGDNQESRRIGAAQIGGERPDPGGVHFI